MTIKLSHSVNLCLIAFLSCPKTEKWTSERGKNATEPFHYAFNIFYVVYANFYWGNEEESMVLDAGKFLHVAFWRKRRYLV